MPTYIIISYDKEHIDELSRYLSFETEPGQLFAFNIIDDIEDDVNWCLAKIIETYPAYVIIADVEKIENKNKNINYNDASYVLSFLKRFMHQREDSNNISKRMLICSYFHEIEFINYPLLSRNKLCLANYPPRHRKMKTEQILSKIDDTVDFSLSKTIETNQ